ncbi:hypothetical protein C8J57DRAFT_1376632 [Mycena rebaudengoi]|jgi:hypothetical protein|nr:hypothetical protein C8J57DRAFT_1376632 [Mycena rebaudengoi]
MPPAVDLSSLYFFNTFYGDDRDPATGPAFINELRRAAVVYDDIAHDRVIKMWAINLQAEAAAWWKDAAVWMGKNQKDIDTVVKEFEDRWPSPETTKKKPHQLMEEFERITLSDTDVGKLLLDEHGAETTYQLQFAKDLKKKARAAGDTNNLMVKHAIQKLPLRLREAIGPAWTDILTWDELVVKVEAVSRARLVEVDTKAAKEKEIEDAIRALTDGDTGRMPPTAATQSVEERKPQPATYIPYSPTVPRSPYPRIHPPVSPRNLMRTSATPRPQTPRRYPTNLDAFADVAPRTSKVIKLTFEDTISGWRDFQRATRDWDEKWGSETFPNQSRPYPLQPGGVENGCWKCGKDGHFGRDCSAPEEEHVNPKEASWRQSQLRGGRNDQFQTPAQPRTPPQIRSRLPFPIPSGPFDTPSPAFPRARPPHLANTANNVFAMYSADGFYVGDSDGGYTPVEEWEEGYAAAVHDLLGQGNGNGSSAY